MTLARRATYLAHVKAGIKQDTLYAFSQVYIRLDKLFPDQTLKRAEKNMAQFENKGRPAQTSSNYRKDRFHPYQRSDKGVRDQRSSKPAWKNIGAYNQKRKGKASHFLARPAKGQSSYK